MNKSFKESKPTKGICVDGSCLGNPNGKIAFKIYRIETNEVLMTKDCLTGTNNQAEFFGLCKAIQMFPEEVIYCDSYIAINWVKRRTHKSAYPHVALEQCVKFLNKLDKLPDIRKWETKLWGENPADFGYKTSKRKEVVATNLIDVKSKAKDLFDKMKGFRVKHSHSKKCALVLVNEILELPFEFEKERQYWNSVKTEIQNM